MIKFNLGPFGCVSQDGILRINLGILTMVEHKHKMTTERELVIWASRFLHEKIEDWQGQIAADLFQWLWRGWWV